MSCKVYVGEKHDVIMHCPHETRNMIYGAQKLYKRLFLVNAYDIAHGFEHFFAEVTLMHKYRA